MAPSIWQLLIILAIVLVLFGAKRLKTLGADLGGAVKGFKSAVKDGSSDEAGEQPKDDNTAQAAVSTDKKDAA